MTLGNARNGKLLYHLTKFDNLESIIENGLIARKILIENNTKFQDVADRNIITKREKFGLNKYIPFHFHPYSAFDVAVKESNKCDFIYLCLERELAIYNKFKIIPKHPLSFEEVQVLEYDEGMEVINWDLVAIKGNENREVKEAKMAECITDLNIPLKLFQSIAVRDEIIRTKVLKILEEYEMSHKDIFVDIRPTWFNESC